MVTGSLREEGHTQCSSMFALNKTSVEFPAGGKGRVWQSPSGHLTINLWLCPQMQT